MNRVILFGLGLGLSEKADYSLKDKVLGFLLLVPPIFVIMTPINAASAAVLSIRGYPPWDKAVLGLIVVAFAGWGINALNHYLDRERDKIIWPVRPLPCGRINSSTALVAVVIAFLCALSLSWVLFNQQTFIILFAAIILGFLYSSYFRDRVGYLSLPPIVGLVSLGGWSAFSPETLFSSYIPWFLYLLHCFWQAGHIMIYYPLHVTKETNVERIIRTPPAFFFVTSPKTSVSIGIAFLGLTLLFSILLPLLTSLSYLYLVPVTIAGIYGLILSIRFLKDISDAQKGLQAFNAVSIFRLVMVVAILLDVFLLQI